MNSPTNLCVDELKIILLDTTCLSEGSIDIIIEYSRSLCPWCERIGDDILEYGFCYVCKFLDIACDNGFLLGYNLNDLILYETTYDYEKYREEAMRIYCKEKPRYEQDLKIGEYLREQSRQKRERNRRRILDDPMFKPRSERAEVIRCSRKKKTHTEIYNLCKF